CAGARKQSKSGGPPETVSVAGSTQPYSPEDRRGSMNATSMGVWVYGNEFQMLKELDEARDQVKSKRMKILILDDSKRVGSALQRQLISLGHTALAVTTEEAAMKELAVASYDSMVCDLVLEQDQSGVLVLEKIRNVYPNVRRV